MAFESSEYLLKLSSFCGADNSSPVFEEELKFIRSRREKMKISAGSVENYPTAKNQLTGLCLSGGGIRSATFCLGFIQALFRGGLLKRIDYLSTVSGGGYIGGCLTALLSSDLKNVLYFTGWMVHSIWTRNLSWVCLIIDIIGALFILWLFSRIININKISLHRFY